MWAIIWIRIKEIGGSILTSKIFLWGAILAGAYLIFKGVFKKDKFEEKALPNSGSGLPKGWTAQNAKLIAADGNDVIDGIATLASTKEIWASSLINLSDDQLSLVFYAYNDGYGKANNETLTEAMAKEWNTPLGESNWKKIIARLRGLKLY
jgi:hypothetical protein